MGNVMTFTPERSSQIQRATYDPDTLYLQVTFANNSSYTYAGVPSHVFAAMMRWSSPGAYFHTVIKRHYKVVEKAKTV